LPPENSLKPPHLYLQQNFATEPKMVPESAFWQTRAADNPSYRMPIRPETRWFYPIDWPILSRQIRFGRAGGRCEKCGRPHGQTVRCLPDGRWWDGAGASWQDSTGAPAAWPDIVDYTRVRMTKVVLAACHVDHDPANNRSRNLKAWCQRCHLLHDRAYHRRQARITYRLRRALGDLFDGQYQRW
jgi:hypothetical protein